MPDSTPRYAKHLDASTAQWSTHSAAPDCGLALRVTLGDMPIEDAFWIGLPSDLCSIPLTEFLHRVFPRGESDRVAFQQRLALDVNPDLADMYDSLTDLFARVEAGMCTVDIYQNHGPKLDGSRPVEQIADRRHTPPLLDLVLEQRFSPIDYAVRRGEFTNDGDAMAWMQTHVLLYFLHPLGHTLQVRPSGDADASLLPIAKLLEDSGHIQRSHDSGMFDVTERGHETIHEMTAAAENALDRYEIFSDVQYDPCTGECNFLTGVGADYRVPVYEAESLPSGRTVLLVELYDRTFAHLEADWRSVIHEREFFESVLMPIVERPLVDDDTIDEIIEAGFAFMEAQARESLQADDDRRLRRILQQD